MYVQMDTTSNEALMQTQAQALDYYNRFATNKLIYVEAEAMVN